MKHSQFCSDTRVTPQDVILVLVHYARSIKDHEAGRLKSWIKEAMPDGGGTSWTLHVFAFEARKVRLRGTAQLENDATVLAEELRKVQMSSKKQLSSSIPIKSEERHPTTGAASASVSPSFVFISYEKASFLIKGALTKWGGELSYITMRTRQLIFLNPPDNLPNEPQAIPGSSENQQKSRYPGGYSIWTRQIRELVKRLLSKSKATSQPEEYSHWGVNENFEDFRISRKSLYDSATYNSNALDPVCLDISRSRGPAPQDLRNALSQALNMIVHSTRSALTSTLDFADHYLNMSDFRTAVSVLERAVQDIDDPGPWLDPSQQELMLRVLRLKLATIDISTGKYDKARDSLKSLQRQHKYYLSDLESKKRIPEAIDRNLEGEIKRWLGVARCGAGYYNDAIDILEEFEESWSNVEDGRQDEFARTSLFRAQQDLALAYSLQGRTYEAWELIKNLRPSGGQGQEYQHVMDQSGHPQQIQKPAATRNSSATYGLMVTIARLKMHRGEYRSALSDVRDALIGFKQHFGEKNIKILEATTLQAQLLALTSNIGDAERECSSILHTLMSEPQLGPNHPLALENNATLAFILRSQSRLDEAIATGKNVAVVADRIMLANDHPLVLRCGAELGMSYWAAGKYESAAHELQTIIELSKKRYGRIHPETLHYESNLAQVYLSSGYLDLARNITTRVLVSQADLDICGTNAINREIKHEARPSTRILKAGSHRSSFGEKPEERGSIRHYVEGIQAKLLEDMETTYDIAARDFIDGLGTNDPGRRPRAILTNNGGVVDRRAHPYLIETLRLLAMIEMQGGDQDSFDVAQILLLVVQFREKQLGEMHQLTLASQFDRGMFLREMGALKEANDCLLSVFNGQCKQQGRSHSRTLSVERELIMTACMLPEGPFSVLDLLGRGSSTRASDKTIFLESDSESGDGVVRLRCEIKHRHHLREDVTALSDRTLYRSPVRDSGHDVAPTKSKHQGPEPEPKFGDDIVRMSGTRPSETKPGGAAKASPTKVSYSQRGSKDSAVVMPAQENATLEVGAISNEGNPSQDWSCLEKGALDIWTMQKDRLGVNHPETLTSLSWLFAVQLLLEKPKKADKTRASICSLLRSKEVEEERFMDSLCRQQRIADICLQYDQFKKEGIQILEFILDHTRRAIGEGMNLTGLGLRSVTKDDGAEALHSNFDPKSIFSAEATDGSIAVDMFRRWKKSSFEKLSEDIMSSLKETQDG